MKFSNEIAPVYQRAVFGAAVYSVILLILSFMVLDGGATADASLAAMAGFWVMVVLVIARRPQMPTRVDLRVIRLGILPTVVVAQFLVRWIWHLRGVRW